MQESSFGRHICTDWVGATHVEPMAAYSCNVVFGHDDGMGCVAQSRDADSGGDDEVGNAARLGNDLAVEKAKTRPL